MVGAVTSLERTNGKNTLNTITKASNIYIGDIIKLRKGEIAPCDLLVLGSTDTLNGNFICRVDSFYDDGKALRQLKESITLTKSFTPWIKEDSTVKLFLKHLDAKVEYSRSPGDHSIKGSFKLKADPRMEQFSDVNIVKKGSIMKSKHIYGLVLFNGRMCLDSNTKQTVFIAKNSKLEDKISAFTVVLVTINIALAILLTVIFYRTAGFGDTSAKVLDDKSFFLNFISLTFSCLPLSINILINTFHWAAAFKLQSFFRGFTTMAAFIAASNESEPLKRHRTELPSSKPAEKGKQKDEAENSFKVLNPNVIPDLGDIDDAFFDKTNTLTSTNYDIKTISFKGKFYQSSQSSFEQGLQDQKLPGRANDILPTNNEFKPSQSAVYDQQLLTNNKLDDFDENKRAGTYIPKFVSKPSATFKYENGLHSPRSHANSHNMIQLSTGKKPGVPEEKKNSSNVLRNLYTEIDFLNEFNADRSMHQLLLLFSACHSANVVGPR